MLVFGINTGVHWKCVGYSILLIERRQKKWTSGLQVEGRLVSKTLREE